MPDGHIKEDPAKKKGYRMSVEMKVLEKAIEAKDFTFLARKLVEKLQEVGWTDEDIATMAEKLAAAAGKG